MAEPISELSRLSNEDSDWNLKALILSIVRFPTLAQAQALVKELKSRDPYRTVI